MSSNYKKHQNLITQGT